VAKRDHKNTAAARDFDRVFWITLAAFAAATLLAYQPAWHGDFLWDDNGHLTKPVLRSLGGLWRIWFVPGATQQFYPVVHSAFWLQFHLWGLAPTGYHLVNVLLHACNAALLTAILRRLKVPGAVLAGAIFALHPVQVESVAWITELKNTMSGVFYFAAALIYLRFDADRRPAAYWSAIGLFVLALLSKSVTATLPAGLLIVLWWQRGTITWTRDVRPLMPWFATSIAAGAMTVWMERTFIGARGDAFDFTIIERTLIAGRATVFYLANLVWPANLAFSYPHWQVSQAVWWQYLFPVGVIAAIGALWMLRHWSRAPIAALLFFGVTLGPALGFVNAYPFVFSFVADHFQYLASAGIIALAAAGVVIAGNRFAKTLMPGLAAVVLVPLVLITWRDSHAYVSAEVLYRTTIDRNPVAWLAQSNLAGILLDRQPPDGAEALIHARTAVALAPQRPETQFNLGLALEATGDAAGAIEPYRAAIARTSAVDVGGMRAAQIHERLAGVLRASGRVEESVAEAAIATSLMASVAGDSTKQDSGTQADQVQAAIALVEKGRAADAAGPLARFAEQFPDRMDVRYALGLTFEQLNQFDRAVESFQIVMAAEPTRAAVRRHLGSALHSLGRREEAVAAYEGALALDPNSADAHNDLGVALAELRRFREAEPHFAEALRLNPNDAQARDNLARTRQIIQRGGRGPAGLDN
jgi:tetratricopeptide (TPR) repeat protein